MTGAALILMASQLGKLFGINLINNDFFSRIAELCAKLRQIHAPTLLLGLALLALALAMRRLAPKAPTALIICVVAISASWLLHLEQLGVALVPSFPRGLPRFAIPTVEVAELPTLLLSATGIALLTY